MKNTLNCLTDNLVFHNPPESTKYKAVTYKGGNS